MIRRAASALVAAACAALAGWLALHHPLSPWFALLACIALTGWTHWRPARWPLWLLPLWAVGLAPWSGWLTVEEYDLAVLSVAAAGYARLAMGWAPAPRQTPDPARSPAKVALLLLPLVASVLGSLYIGVRDAGGWEFGWWQGFREPMNSVRLAKPVFEVLLLLPLWRAACRAAPAAASRDLVLGLCGTLAVSAAFVLWERLAFTGLADFSSDYRATGPFWEMHIGGAALDATLSMTLGAAAVMLMRARTPVHWAASAALFGLGAYAAIVTFSRIVFLSVPLALGLIALLSSVRDRGGPRDDVAAPDRHRQQRALAAWTLAFACLVFWMFPTSGYRGLLAMLGVAVLLLPLPATLALLRPVHLGFGAGLGVLLACMVALATMLLPKGVYIAYGLLFVAAALSAVGVQRVLESGAEAGRSVARFLGVLALACFLATVAAMVGVATFWGGTSAAMPALGGAAAAVAAALIARAPARRGRPLWSPRWEWHGRTAAMLVAAGVTVAAFGGGEYLVQRLSQSTEDGEGRLGHWQRSLALLNGTDWIWGKGLGRYWARQADTGRPDDQTGDYRWVRGEAGGAGSHVVLTSGLHILGWGEKFRLSQRVSPSVERVGKLSFRARAEKELGLDIVVCTNHLIYPGHCASESVAVKGLPGQWQEVTVLFKQGGLPSAHPLWPALKMFEIALDSNGSRVELDDLRLSDASGRELLANGDFERGMAHWFFTSDRWHMPFHAKSLVVHLLFEQGAAGLAAFALAVGAALWRVTFGAGRLHALAPMLAGAIIGALTVGAIDSLLDMPRIAFLLLWLVAVALALPRGRAARVPVLPRA